MTMQAKVFIGFGTSSATCQRNIDGPLLCFHGNAPTLRYPVGYVKQQQSIQASFTY